MSLSPGWHSTEVVSVLLTQQTWVCILNVLKNVSFLLLLSFVTPCLQLSGQRPNNVD